ncbi:MAG: sporulation initiation inhibitor protein Soj [Myxococcota bacterium]
MGRTIAVCSQKGGVGKTTTVLNLGYALSRLGHRTLLVDLDPQGALLLSLKQEDRSRKGVSDVLGGRCELEGALIETAEKNLALLPFGTLPPKETKSFVELIEEKGNLRALFEKLSGEFEYCLADCPAGIGALTSAIMTAADSALVVMLCDPLAYRSVHQILELLEEIQSGDGKKTTLEGILLTQHDVRSKTGSLIAQDVWENFPPDTVFQTVIPRHPLFIEASYQGVPIERMGRLGSGLGARYTELAHEVVLGGAARLFAGEPDEIKPLL